MKILMRNNKEKAWKLVETAAYTKEDELQNLLAESPELISISDVREGATPLVAAVREFPLPIGYIDLIAFSASGDIAIIECKLASNADAKRKVIGQVLEYGANLWQMSYEELDQAIHNRSGFTLVGLMEQSTPESWDEESFRSNVETALIEGNFILIIVVDEINDELARIVRYMNATGNQGFDFAALEMRRFHHESAEMLIPRFYGPTQTVKSKSGNQQGKRWDETRFFGELEARHGYDAVSVARRLLQWSQKNVITWWGSGTRSGSFVPYFYHNEREHQLFAVWTYGVVEIYFQWYSYKPPFDDLEKRKEILKKLNSIEGVNIPIDGINRRPSIRMEILAKNDKIEQFIEIIDWIVGEIRNS